MILGFTGTSQGMTQKQRATVRYLFNELQVTELHHGECVGADGQANRIAMDLKVIRRIAHPPSDKRKSVFCSCDEYRAPKSYLNRNKDIAAEGIDGLIATPNQMTEVLRSGTWATVRYAQKLKRRIWIVYPDGTFKEEVAR